MASDAAAAVRSTAYPAVRIYSALVANRSLDPMRQVPPLADLDEILAEMSGTGASFIRTNPRLVRAIRSSRSAANGRHGHTGPMFASSPSALRRHYQRVELHFASTGAKLVEELASFLQANRIQQPFLAWLRGTWIL